MDISSVILSYNAGTPMPLIRVLSNEGAAPAASFCVPVICLSKNCRDPSAENDIWLHGLNIKSYA